MQNERGQGKAAVQNGWQVYIQAGLQGQWRGELLADGHKYIIALYDEIP